MISRLQETHPKYKDTDNVEGWKRKYCSNTNKKKAGILIFISHKAEFGGSKINRVKEGQYTVTKGPIL